MASFTVERAGDGWLNLHGILAKDDVGKLVNEILGHHPPGQLDQGAAGLDMRALESMVPSAASSLHQQLQIWANWPIQVRVCSGVIAETLEAAGFGRQGQHPLLVEKCTARPNTLEQGT